MNSKFLLQKLKKSCAFLLLLALSMNSYAQITVSLSNNSLNNRVSNTQSVTLFATFSESIASATPKISLSGIMTDTAMNNLNTYALKPNNGWISSTGSFQDCSGSSGSHPCFGSNDVKFAYIDNSSIYKDFTISSGSTDISVELYYIQNGSPDTAKVRLTYYNGINIISSNESSLLTGTSLWTSLDFTSSIPVNADKVRVELVQINESEYWAGNYGFRFKNLKISGVEGGNDENKWSYTWTVSTTVNSTTATVSAGSSYTGSESMTFVIDNERPYVVSTTLSNNQKSGYISATDTNTLTITFNEEINATTFTASDVTILPENYFSITEHTSTDNTTFIGYLNVLSNYTGVVTLTLNEDSLEDLVGNSNTASSVSFIYDNSIPTVTLTDSDSDNIISNSDVVTITATFSESMAATPTLSLSGIMANKEMTSTASDSVWTFTWTVSSSINSVTATVSGTDLAGNSYNGSDILNFIMTEEDLVFHYDASNLLSYNQQTTSASNNTIIDLSGNGNDGYIEAFDHIYYDSSEEAFYFNGSTKRDGKGLFIKNLNYISGSSDQINELRLEARVKLKSDITNHDNDERIILSFDRSSVFRWGIGSDQNSQSSGKLAFAFSNSEGVHDIYDSGFNSDLRDDQWHDIKILFKANQANGLEFYVDNQLTYTDPSVYSPIGNHNENQSPRYGIVGNGNEMTTQGGSTHPDNMFYGWIQNIKYYTKSLPTVALSSSVSSMKVSNSSVVTITASFSESMSATPTISLSGIISNLNMTPIKGVELLNSNFWSNNEPNHQNNSEDYGELTNGKLNDIPNGINNSAIIEFYDNRSVAISDYTYVGSFQGHSYYTRNSGAYWKVCEEEATSLGGSLFIINSDAEFDYVKSVISNIDYHIGLYQDTNDSNYSEPNGGWKWIKEKSLWNFSWTVSGSTVTSTTATVSGTDLAGNPYSGTESLTFVIDNINPTLVSFTDSDTDNIVNNFTNLTFSATFSESMAASPTLSISGLVTDTAMTVSASTNSTTWSYFWDVPSGSDGTYFATVSATDLAGNYYTGTESITFTIDNTHPLIESVTVTDTNSKVILIYNEPVLLYDPSYSVSNFSLNKTGGAATVSYTGYSFSTTDSNTIILNITLTGEPTGDELLEVGPAGASTLIDRAGNYALNYSDSSQTSNTVYLTNVPPKFTSTSVSSNNTSITIAFSEGVTANASGMELSKTDFTLAVSGGTAVLASATPTALTKIDSKTYILSTSYSVPSNGSEILTVTPINSGVFDLKGMQINLSAAQSNTIQLNDQAGPSITGITLDSQNRYVDLTFSEGVYATSSPTTSVTSSSFTLSQQSGPSYGMTISSITTNGGGVLSGGETTLRFNLGYTVKPTGQEVFAITATDSSSVVDSSGISMTVSQTNNTFKLKPPTSGGVSPQKSTISAAPAEMIANGINTVAITVQAKDSIGQNFLEGGYQITLFGPDGDLITTDNQNGTYSASYTPDAIAQDFQELIFGFRVAGTNGTNTAILKLYLDEDGDGVYNINDACLGTEAGLEVDATGCALNQLDSDKDGIFDDLDECPDTPEFEINNVKGTPTYGELIPTVIDEKGCGASQRDTDGDGIVDTEDNCIETANADQADSDGDGIGDVCDTDNPLPEITTTEIKFVQLPQNGTTVGKIEATDPDGEILTFTQDVDSFTGILSIASDGSVIVSSGALLNFDSAYNGANLSFTVSDGENEVPGSVKILIEDAPRPPEISISTIEISEDAEIGAIVGYVEVKDPMGGQIISINLQGDGFIELVDGVLKTTQELDYETKTSHPFTINAKASDRVDGPGLSGSKSESVSVSDIPNATYSARFFLSIFNVEDESLGAKVDYRRFFNPHNKNVGKWKVKKRIKGGADADKFTIRSGAKSEEQQKNGGPVQDENEDYLDFIKPPNYENPEDANKDNIYEVEVEYINTDDGAPEVPIVVTQTNLQVPEGKSTAIELQSQPVLPTEDNDGDGIVDILDNSPLVSNPDQSDEDGDGVGDVTDDSDQDGVWNPFDTCPDTPLGEVVDIDGCLIYYLPASNFSLSKTEKCAGENSINISVVDVSVNYNVSVDGARNISDSFTGSSWTLDQLSAGIYNVCISVEGVNPLEFERCFEVTINEPDPLLVSSFYNKQNQKISFDLSGGTIYNITQNGKTIQTSSSKFTVELEKGINNISISTGIECQGLFENTYLNSYDVKYVPNPFREQLQLYIGGQDNLVEIEVYSPNGQLIDYKTVSLPFGVRNYNLETSSYKPGIYIIKIKGQTLNQSIQVIKK